MQSIESQEKELKRVIDENRLDIIGIIREEKSAHTRGRRLFTEMMQRLDKGEANGILTWHGNRLARNAFDGGWIITLMDEGKILEVKTTHRTYYNTPDDKFFLQLEFGISKKDSDDKSIVVKRGLMNKAEKGWMPGVAPLGYLNTPELVGGSRFIKIDPERFDLMKKVWEMMASGKHSVIEIQNIMTNEWGFRTRQFKRQGGKPITLSMLYRIFNNPFYYGYFEYPEGSGEMHKGNHEAITTEEVFNRVQFLLGKKIKAKPHTKNFAFTGLMRCGECGAQITAEEKWKHQKNGNVHHYIYYRCTRRKNPKCRQLSIKEEILEGQIINTLEQIKIPPEFHEMAMSWLKKRNEKEFEDKNTVISSQQRAYTLCVNKLKGLIDMRATGEITPEEFSQRKKELLEEKSRLEQLLNNTGGQVNKWMEIAEDVFTFASDAKEKFENGDWQTKKQILSALGSHLVLEDRKLSVDLENALLPMKAILKSLKNFGNRLEPPKSGSNKRKTGISLPVSPALLREGDLHPRPPGYEPGELLLLHPAAARGSTKESARDSKSL